MSEDPREPLTGEQLAIRRSDARRRGRRRRSLVLAIPVLLIAGVGAAIAIGSGGGGAGSRRAGTAATSDTTPRAITRATTTKPVVTHRRSGTTTAQLHAIERTITANDYVTRGSPHHKAVALTFDDGPGPTSPKILRWLKTHHVPATFFLIGANARENPKVVRAEIAAGDVVGDHTELHQRLGALSSAGQIQQIDDGATAIRAIIGRHIRLFRPPYGSFNEETLALLKARHMLMVLWTVDTDDYASPGVERIVYTALSGARAGSIVLMHDGGGDRSETLAALPRIVHGLRVKGYKLVTIPDLLVLDPVPADQPPPRELAGG